MSVTILYFASLREGLGVERESVELPDGVVDAGGLLAWLRQRGGMWQELLAEGRAVRIAVNQTMADGQTVVGPRAEVAFFPPVTGG